MTQVENEVQRLIYELQLLEGASETLQTQIGLVNASMNELQLANVALEGLKHEEQGADILVPLGGGAYLKAKIEDAERLIIGVGADVAVEKTVSEAQEDVGARLLELDKTRVSLRQQLDQALSRMETVRRRVQEITQQPAQGTTQNV